MRNLNKIVSAAFLLCCFTTAFTQVNLEWINKNSGTDSYGANAYYNSLAIDNGGNVCVAGEMYTGSGNSVLVAKYTSAGALVWSTSFSENNSTYEYVRGGVGVDAANNIYITGYVYNYNNNYNYYNYYDLFVTKLDANGNVLWTKIYDSGSYDYMDFSGIVVEPNGNVILAGSTYNYNNYNNYYDMVFLKYDTNGNLLWSNIMDGGYYEYLRSIDSDSNGNLFASFQTYNYNGNGYNTMGVTKLNSNGVQQAYQIYNVNSTTQFYSYANSFDVNANGDVFMSGYIYDYNNYSSNYYDELTVKYDNNLNQLWENRFDGGMYDYYGALKADDQGNVLVGINSYNNNSGTYDWNVVKYDAVGNQLWLAAVSQSSNNWILDMAVDNQGNAYPTGYDWGNNNIYSAKTVRVNADGTIGWTVAYSNPNSTYSQTFPYDIEVDNNGNLYLAGQDYDQSSFNGNQIFVLKYSQNFVPVAPEFSATSSSVSCIGSNDGTITLDVTAGNEGPFTYSIDSAATFTVSNVFTALVAGTYNAVVKDSKGHLAAVQQVVVGTVADVEAPVVTVAGDIQVTTDAGTCGAVVSYQASVSDNCSGTLSYSVASGSLFPVGTTVVTVTGTDLAGNSTSVSFNVVVSDVEAPVASAQNLTVQLDANGQASISAAQLNNGSSDACGIASVSLDKSTFDCSNVGANTVVITVLDVNGNSSSSAAIVTVEDKIAPSVSCSGDVNVTAQRNDCTPVVTWNAPVISDNCTYSVVSNHNSGDRFEVGTTVVTYTATDASGNVSSCSFNVTVQPNPLEGTTTVKTYVGGNNVSCFGKKDGEASVSVNGGCLPYSYSWNTSPVQTGTTATGLAAGTYTVTVTDANNQSIALSVTLSQPQVLTADAGANATVYYGYAPQACATLVSSVNGGSAAYSYSWSNGATSANNTVCPSATTTYTLNVTDANGCKASDVAVICAVDVRCEQGGNAIKIGQGTKVLICHTSGNNKVQTLCVAADAVASHLAHGDKLGSCGVNASCFQSSKTDEGADVAAEVVSTSDLTAYPNPFANTTTLVFTATGSERTVVQIMDMKGAIMKVAFDANTLEGQVYKIDVDGSSWADAIYIARIVNGDQVQNVKLVLAK